MTVLGFYHFLNAGEQTTDLINVCVCVCVCVVARVCTHSVMSDSL